MSVIGLGSGFSVRDTCMTSSVKVSCSGKCKFTIGTYCIITRAIFSQTAVKAAGVYSPVHKRISTHLHGAYFIFESTYYM